MVPIAVAVGVLALIAAAAAPILIAIRRRTARNRAFLAGAIASHTLAPGAPTQLVFQTAGGASHVLWLDLELSGPRAPAFELALVLRVGGTTLLDAAYPVTFDEDEHDAHGLPSQYGTTALNTSVVAMPRSARIKTVLRIHRFDGGSASTPAELSATLIPGAGTTFARAALLVTNGDAPA